MDAQLREKKSQCYDIIKAAAMVLVVLAHVLRMYVGDGAFTPVESSRFLRWLSLYIYAFHMPLFVLISGCVYGYCVQAGKYENPGRFVLGKARRILIPYLAFGLLWVAPVMELCNLTELSFWQYCYRGILQSMDPRHLWYLLALFWIFMIAMVMRPLVKSGKPWYLLFSAALFVLYLMLPKSSFLQLSSALRYQLYFFLGVAVNQYFGTILKIVRKFYLPIFILCPIILIASLKWSFGFVSREGFALVGIVWFLGIGAFLTDRWGGGAISAFAPYRVFNRDSFGIYLFHPMLIYLMFWATTGLSINPWLMSAVVFLVSTAASMGLAELLRRAGLKVLIGE